MAHRAERSRRSHGHTHAGGPPRPPDRPATRSELRIARVLSAAATAAALLTVAGLVLLWPRGEVDGGVLQSVGFIRETHDAEIVSAELGGCGGTGAESPVQCQRLEFEVLGGPNEGERFSAEAPVTGAREPFGLGEKVVVARQQNAQPGFEYSIVDRQRKPALFWLALIFAVAVVALGRLRGLAALAGLGASFVVLLLFVLPALLQGASPVLVAVVGSGAIAFLALYLAHGFSLMTTVALIGTLASLALTAFLGTVFVDLASFTGLASDEASFLNLGAGQVDIAGLILAGVVLGALGALDDMTVTQASAVWELRAADPGMSTTSLFRAGLRIGRDHIASTVNTLVLAYAGASLPLLLLFVLSQQSLATVANGEVMATEIVRTLVGSIGLVTAVPITTWLAAAARPPTGTARPAEAPGRRGRHRDEGGLWLPERRRDTWRGG